MRKFIVYVLCLFLPVYGCIAVTNYIVDPGNIYSEDYVDKVIEGARKGLNVTNVEEMDHRIYKRKLAELYYGQTFDYLVLGSSRTMTISSESVCGKRIINMSVTQCTTEDLIALYEIIKECRINISNVILGVDPTLFNGTYHSNRWKSISEYYYKFFGKEKSESINYAILENLLSISYFKTSLNCITKRISGELEMQYTMSLVNKHKTRRPDGSHYYGLKDHQKSQREIDEDAKSGEIQDYFLDFEELSQEKINEFESLIHSMQCDKPNVVFFLCPYHPVFYKRIININGINKGIDYIKYYAKKNNIKTIGEFDPRNLKIVNRDFYDKVHAKKE